ncbi:MAG: hypothetical protein J6331_02175 [Lentisphaeria bacterium]|nr:hypothetical protein [Lentisphaeria bacterium]
MLARILKHKKLLFTLSGVLLFLIVFWASMPYLLTREWVLKNIVLPRMEKNTGTVITAGKIFCDRSSSETVLFLHALEVRKALGKPGEETEDELVLQAEKVRLSIDELRRFDWKRNVPKEIRAEKILARVHYKGNEFERGFPELLVTHFPKEQRSVFSFRTVLPLGGDKNGKSLAAEGKGEFLTDEIWRVREGTFLLDGKGAGESLLFRISGKREKNRLWTVETEIKAENVHSGNLFSFLQIKRLEKAQFHVKNLSGKFSFLQEEKSTPDLKTLSGKLHAELGNSVIPASLWASGKSGKVLAASFPVLLLTLDQFIGMEKKSLKKALRSTDAEERKKAQARAAELEKYEAKSLLLGNILNGEVPLLLHSGTLDLSIADDLGKIEKCVFSGNMPDSGTVQGSVRLSTGRLVSLEMENRILDLHIPVYFVPGSSVAEPKVDQERTLRKNWELHKKLILEKGVKIVRQQLGDKITVNGKKLSEMTEEEAVKAAEEAVTKGIDRFLKKREKKKKAKKEKKQK